MLAERIVKHLPQTQHLCVNTHDVCIWTRLELPWNQHRGLSISNYSFYSAHLSSSHGRQHMISLQNTELRSHACMGRNHRSAFYVTLIQARDIWRVITSWGAVLQSVQKSFIFVKNVRTGIWMHTLISQDSWLRSSGIKLLCCLMIYVTMFSVWISAGWHCVRHCGGAFVCIFCQWPSPTRHPPGVCQCWTPGHVRLLKSGAPWGQLQTAAGGCSRVHVI